jgi:hypothetical protein
LEATPRIELGYADLQNGGIRAIRRLISMEKIECTH